MKRLVLLYLFVSLLFSTAFSQTKPDSILVAIDTINIYGKVVDELGKPVANAKVLSRTFDKSYNYIQTVTNEIGHFTLKGITPNDILRVRKDGIAVEKSISSTRYLVLVLKPLLKIDLNKNGDMFSITSRRVSIKKKYEYFRKDTTFYLGFHPFGHYSPATYPGGINKFYKYIQDNLVYPKKAIENNIEGLVAIEFTIDKLGSYKDFVITRDIGYGCAEEVLRVIKKSRKWNSAMNGLNVEQRIEIEIPFKLID